MTSFVHCLEYLSVSAHDIWPLLPNPSSNLQIFFFLLNYFYLPVSGLYFKLIILILFPYIMNVMLIFLSLKFLIYPFFLLIFSWEFFFHFYLPVKGSTAIVSNFQCFPKKKQDPPKRSKRKSVFLQEKEKRLVYVCLYVDSA